MGLLKSATEEHREKLLEEHIYAQVASELESNNVSPGLWAKAFADAGGDESQAKARYIRSRFEMLKSMSAMEAEQTKRFEQVVLKAEEVRAPIPKHPVTEFAQGVGQGLKEYYIDSNDLRHPKRFMQSMGEKLKWTFIWAAILLGGPILYTWLVRGW